jgi:hypothetical protein
MTQSSTFVLTGRNASGEPFTLQRNTEAALVALARELHERGAYDLNAEACHTMQHTVALPLDVLVPEWVMVPNPTTTPRG